MPLANGEVFAGYKILQLLGSGGMGEVYLAQHPRLPRRDALKILPAELSANGEFRERFNREADLAATLYHPHIVGIHDRGESDGQLWIAMDYIDGPDAGQLLRDRYPAGMPRREVVEIVTAVADALDYAHESGLLHRDVKPANILLTKPETPHQRVLLADFGIARSLSDFSGLTQTNVALGTVNYAAPEQLMGLPIDGRADQYALAATTYQLLTGSLLFEASNPAVVISQHLNASPPSLTHNRPELVYLDPVLAIALSKNPDNRFPKCIDFAHALALSWAEAASPASGLGATSPAPVVQSRPASVSTKPYSYDLLPKTTEVRDSPQRWPVTVGVIVVILLLAAVAFVVRPWQEQPPPVATPPSTPSTTATRAITFEGMRDLVTAYYDELPAHAMDAWAKLDRHYQDRSGLRAYLDFWATIQSVTLISVTPRDDTSVVARLRYVRLDGQSDNEDRWLRLVLVNGTMLIYDSERYG